MRFLKVNLFLHVLPLQHEEVQKNLEMVGCTLIHTSSDRPNIFYEVRTRTVTAGTGLHAPLVWCLLQKQHTPIIFCDVRIPKCSRM